MASGIEVDTECVTKFQALQKEHKYTFLVMKIENNKEIKVCKILDDAGEEWNVRKGGSRGTPEDSQELWEKVRKSYCIETEPSYIVFDMTLRNKDTGACNDNVVLITWIPDNGPVKSKMIYSSSVDALKRKLVGVSAILQANDESDLDYEHMAKTVREKKTSK